jgi:ABC-type glycerol-3-phosphate transport system permease component
VIDITSAPLTGPQGPKPRKSFSRRNIFLYGTLITIALFYALPLYVMFITSLKGMPEIRLGNVFSPPLEGDVSALGQSVVRGLHRLDLQRVEHRILELCSNHYTIRGLVDHHRVREWLRIVQLEIQRR